MIIFFSILLFILLIIIWSYFLKKKDPLIQAMKEHRKIIEKSIFNAGYFDRKDCENEINNFIIIHINKTPLRILERSVNRLWKLYKKHFSKIRPRANHKQ